MWRATIAGTRIRVSVVEWCRREGMTAEQFVEAYPHLRASDVYDALAYACDHPDEIGADLQADDEQFVQDEATAAE